MSVGFRFFLLLIVLFGVISVYRMRQGDLAIWLGFAEPPVESSYGVPGGRSPVGETLDLDSRVEITLNGVAPEKPSRPKAQTRRRSFNAPSLYASEPFEPPTLDPPPEDFDELIDPALDVPLDGLEPIEWSADPLGPAPDDLIIPDDENGVADEEIADHPGAPEVEPGETPEDDVSYVIHVVEDKDSLWKIAKRYLGKGHRLGKIRELNKDVLKNGDRLTIGMELKVPAPKE